MQPGSWASALKKNLRVQSNDGRNIQDTAHADLAKSHDHAILGADTVRKTAQPAGVVDPNLKAAARQRLLTEALKSRANALTGERHCLGCGRAFHDLSRFAQHILDKHGGINSSEPAEPAASTYYQNNKKIVTSGGDGAGAGNVFPSLVPHEPKLLKLADIARVKNTSADAKSSEQTRNKKLNRTTTTPAAAKTTAPTGGSVHPQQSRRKPDPTAFQAPEGTHAKRKKRPSRLKRIYRRTKAEAAVQHWLSVLSVIEESLQIVGELHGALVNEMQDLQLKQQYAFLSTVTSKDKAELNGRENNLNFVQALLTGKLPTAETNINSTSVGAVFTPSVQLQVLEEQVRVTSERVEQLSSIHATARANLVKSQEQYAVAQGGGGGVGKGTALKLSHAMLSDTTAQDKPVSISIDVARQGEGEEKQAVGANEPPQERAPATTPPDVLLPPAPLPASPPLPSGGMNELNDSNKNKTIVENEVASSTSSHNQNINTSTTKSESSTTSGSTNTSSNSTSSSDSDFGLQWGDTLRAWATHVGVDARKSLQQQQKQQKQKQVKQIQEKHPAEVIVAEPVRVEIVAPTLVKIDTNPIHNEFVPVSGPSASSATDIALQSSQAAAAVAAPPLPTPTDAVNTWLEGVEEVDNAQLETISTTAYSIADEDEGLAPVPPPKSFLGESPDAAACVAAKISANGTPSLPYHCVVCNITASGAKPWQDHLASRRHAAKIAQTANTQPQEKQQQHPVQMKDFPILIQSNLSSKCYTGPNADVEPYVTHIISPELNEATTALLKQLLEWQERTRRLDPVNFKRKRRLVSGMREVVKFVKMNKAKLLIVAPNIGPVPTSSDGSNNNKSSDNNGDTVDSAGNSKNKSSPQLLSYPIQSALDMAKYRGIPTVFALTRQRMGKILGARKTASAFVVLDASGAEHLVANVLELAAAAAAQRV